MRGTGPLLCLAVDRPRAIAGLGEEALLDPGYSPDGDWPGAPALGLGFALRLVRNLAEAVGGSLAIEQARFALFLPAEGERRFPPAMAKARPDAAGRGLIHRLPGARRHGIGGTGL